MTLLPAALRRIAFLLALGLFPALALAALNETYEGLLIPDTFETPIPITVEIRELSGLLVGHVKTGPPMAGSAPIAGGENEYGKCNIRVPLPSGIVLKLAGTCLSNVFEGRYTLLNRQEGKPRGSFRLMRKETGKRDSNDRKSSPSAALPPATSLTECIKANTRCLLSCPRGDYNSEFLCSNRCRHKFQSCKGKNSQPAPPVTEAPATEQP
jgi:hypothetical protein